MISVCGRCTGSRYFGIVLRVSVGARKQHLLVLLVGYWEMIFMKVMFLFLEDRPNVSCVA